jgi:CubicO group peptidase (beta-lactamase class C family)
MEADLPRASAEIERGMDEGLHVGAQLCVSIGGRIVADLAFGSARPGVPMSTDTVMVWLSATKVLAAIAVAQQWERGELDLDERVADHIPPFAAGGKGAVTIRQLLVHTGGFRTADVVGDRFPDIAWDDAVSEVCAAPLERGWVPGRKAGYHATGAHLVLAEIVRLIDGRPFDIYAREAILEPIGANDYWVGMPPERYAGYGERIGWMHRTDEGRALPIPGFDTPLAAAAPWVSRNGRGPAHDLVKVMEVLAGRGERAGVQLLQPQTVDAMAAHQRVGMVDQTFGVRMDWGLGFVVDTKYALGRTLQPYGYGAHASPRTFGHGGSQSSTAFVDPEFGLAVAMVCNGMCGEVPNTRRQHAILTALYGDLGFAWS